MEKKDKDLLTEISYEFYAWLEEMVKENWQTPIEDPIETFIYYYEGENGDVLLSLYQKYEGNEKELKFIDKFLQRVVDSVNDSIELSLEFRGGKRDGSGRKRKSQKGEKVCTISFCCSPEQKAKLDEDVKKSGKSRSDYIIEKIYPEK